MVEVAGSEFEIPADLVLFAMGFTGPVTAGLLDGLGVAKDPAGHGAAPPEGGHSARHRDHKDHPSGRAGARRAARRGRGIAMNPLAEAYRLTLRLGHADSGAARKHLDWL